MSVDVFGRQLIYQKEIHKGPPGLGFILTNDGNYDIEKKKLSNVGVAVKEFDAINLRFFNSRLKKFNKDIIQNVEEHIHKQELRNIDKFNIIDNKFVQVFEKIDKINTELENQKVLLISEVTKLDGKSHVLNERLREKAMENSLNLLNEFIAP